MYTLSTCIHFVVGSLPGKLTLQKNFKILKPCISRSACIQAYDPTLASRSMSLMSATCLYVYTHFDGASAPQRWEEVCTHLYSIMAILIDAFCRCQPVETFRSGRETERHTARQERCHQSARRREPVLLVPSLFRAGLTPLSQGHAFVNFLLTYWC